MFLWSISSHFNVLNYIQTHDFVTNWPMLTNCLCHWFTKRFIHPCICLSLTLKVSASTSAPLRLVWEEMPTKNSLPVKSTSLPSSVAPPESPSSPPISTTVRFSSDITLRTASTWAREERGRDGQKWKQTCSIEFNLRVWLTQSG